MGEDPQKNLAKLFAELDLDHDGALSEEELLKALQQKGLAGGQLQEALAHIMEADAEHLHSLSLEQFVSSKEVKKIFDAPRPETRFLRLNTDFENALRMLTAGGVAGAVSRTVVAPFERLKIIFQTQVHPPQYTSILQGLTKMYRDEGIRGYFKGNGINCARIFPASALQFYSYDSYQKLYLKHCTPESTKNLNPYQRLFIGGCAGITALVATYPLEMIRARLTIQTRITDAAIKIANTEGPLALYKGLWPSIIGVIPYVGLDFAVYETLKQNSPKNEHGNVDRITTLMNGAIAGSCAQTVAYPLDVVRRRLQVQDFQKPATRHYSSMSDAFVKIWKQEGVRGFYRGLLPNYLKVAPAIATSFFVFEEMKKLFNISKK